MHAVATGEITAMHAGLLGMIAQAYSKDLGEKTKRGQRRASPLDMAVQIESYGPSWQYRERLHIMKFTRNLPRAPAIEQLAVPLWPDAGKALGLGKNRTYDAAKAGEIPTVRFGRTIRVPVAALRKMLGEPERPDRAHDMGRSVEPTKEGPIRMKRHELLKMQVRLPPDVHEWLSEQAERNMSSINSELVRCVRDAMDRQVPCTTPPHDRPGAAS